MFHQDINKNNQHLVLKSIFATRTYYKINTHIFVHQSRKLKCLLVQEAENIVYLCQEHWNLLHLVHQFIPVFRTSQIHSYIIIKES